MNCWSPTLIAKLHVLICPELVVKPHRFLATALTAESYGNIKKY